MNKYNAILALNGCLSLEVEANNYEEAEKIAYKAVSEEISNKVAEYRCHECLERGEELIIFQKFIECISVDDHVEVERIVDEELLKKIEEKERELALLKAQIN